MVEQTNPCKCHHHAILIAGLNHLVVPDRASWLCYIFYAAFVCSVNIVAKGEECIGTQGYAGKAVKL